MARRVCSRSASPAQTAHLSLGADGRPQGGSAGGEDKAPTSVSLFDQGLIQVLQAVGHRVSSRNSLTFWRCRSEPDGQGPLEPLAAFMTNPAGSAIVNATGAIRQVVHGEDKIQRRYLVIAEGHADKPGHVVQVQLR